jgi:hypothetical protein
MRNYQRDILIVFLAIVVIGTLVILATVPHYCDAGPCVLGAL